jgi:hypothetical protein
MMLVSLVPDLLFDPENAPGPGKLEGPSHVKNTMASRQTRTLHSDRPPVVAARSAGFLKSSSEQDHCGKRRHED